MARNHIAGMQSVYTVKHSLSPGSTSLSQHSTQRPLCSPLPRLIKKCPPPSFSLSPFLFISFSQSLFCSLSVSALVSFVLLHFYTHFIGRSPMSSLSKPSVVVSPLLLTLQKIIFLPTFLEGLNSPKVAAAAAYRERLSWERK